MLRGDEALFESMIIRVKSPKEPEIAWLFRRSPSKSFNGHLTFDGRHILMLPFVNELISAF